MNPKPSKVEWCLIVLNLGLYLGLSFYMAVKVDQMVGL